jgi:uncharacterized protein YjiS (DUF1127 family)
MFNGIVQFFDTLSTMRRRRANLRFTNSLSDEVLRDTGVERLEIVASFVSPQPGCWEQNEENRAEKCLPHG